MKALTLVLFLVLAGVPLPGDYDYWTAGMEGRWLENRRSMVTRVVGKDVEIRVGTLAIIWLRPSGTQGFREGMLINPDFHIKIVKVGWSLAPGNPPVKVPLIQAIVLKR